MSFNVVIDTSALDQTEANLSHVFDNWSDMVEQFLDERTIPALEAESASQRKVRTGTYSGTWDTETASDTEVDVTTDAYYVFFLEYGTSRGIAPKPVIGTVVKEMPAEIGDFILHALTDAVSE